MDMEFVVVMSANVIVIGMEQPTALEKPVLKEQLGQISLSQRMKHIKMLNAPIKVSVTCFRVNVNAFLALKVSRAREPLAVQVAENMATV